MRALEIITEISIPIGPIPPRIYERWPLSKPSCNNFLRTQPFWMWVVARESLWRKCEVLD